MNLRQKLILLILMAGILPALVIGLISLQNSRAALEQQIFDQLEAQRTIKANQITQHFASAEHDIQTLADNLALMIEKQGLETAISQVDQNGQTLFSRYIERNDYYDLFLLDTEGYCFYSVTEEADYQTNLISGKFKDSGLGEVVQKALFDSQYHMSDLAPYAPSNGDPAAFIAAPVMVQNELVMILAMQLSLDGIDAIMSERTGLGNTGETYLVGADLLMRSNSFLDPINHSVEGSFANPELGKVDTEAVKQAGLGNLGSQIVIDYNGNPVLSAYAPLRLNDDVMWTILAEIDEAEAFAPIAALQITMLIVAGVGVVLIIFLAFVFGAIISKPMLNLAHVMSKIEHTGDLSLRFKDPSKDETGQAGHALNALLVRQKNAITEVNLVMGAIAAGDFSRRVDMDLVGDFNSLKHATNNFADSVANTMHSLGQVMSSLSAGDFSARMTGNIEANFRKQVDDAMTSMEVALGEIGQVMQALAQGRFNRRIEVQLDGDLNLLKQNINDSMDALEQALEEVTQVASAISKGDLNQTMSNHYEGDLNNIAIALNGTSVSVAGIVGEVRLMAQNVGQGADEIAKGGQDLTNRTAAQASSLEETAASMEQMAGSVRLNANNADKANDLMKDSMEQAETSGMVVSQAVEAMGKIAHASQKIADIISLIDGIAFQTNLLALNASVEAARAGEHGRGFAVVAGEVRSLAQRAAGAAKDITDLIHDSSDRVEQGSLLVNQMGTSLDKIRSSLSYVSTTVSEIAAASNEQASGIEQVNHAVSQLDSLNQQNSALVEESAAAADALTEQAAELNNLMQFFSMDAAAPSTGEAKPMPEHLEIKTLVSDLNGQ